MPIQLERGVKCLMDAPYVPILIYTRMWSRRNTARILLLLLLIPSVRLAAESIELGFDDGWARLSHADGVEVVPGRGGYADVRLLPTGADVTSATDLALFFDHAPVGDRAGRYHVDARAVEITPVYRVGGAAGGSFAGEGSRLELTPRPGALFNPLTQWSSFSISFALYPITLTSGEVLLEWRARLGSPREETVQTVQATIEARTLTVVFENFFAVPGGTSVTVALNGRTGLIPRTWSHHLIRFDARSGLLEYVVDGRPEDAVHVSRSGREDGTVFLPEIAPYPSGPLRVGGGYRGVIDEFIITGATLPPVAGGPFRHSGIIESAVFDLGSPAAVITGTHLQLDTPGESDLFVYLRTAERRSSATSLPTEWVPVIDGAPAEPLSGRFVQMRAELHPGYGGEVSPSLSSVIIDYQGDERPMPPADLVATPGNQTIMLEWLPVPEPDVRGYLVYYGEMPGRYFGTGAHTGPSPVDVGPATSVILDGLVNGTLYYLSVAAYDAAGVTRDLLLSREVTARPSGVYR